MSATHSRFWVLVSFGKLAGSNGLRFHPYDLAPRRDDLRHRPRCPNSRPQLAPYFADTPLVPLGVGQSQKCELGADRLTPTISVFIRMVVSGSTC